MVTKNNEYVSEGPNNDQMKYLCSDLKSKHYSQVLHTFDCHPPQPQPDQQKPQLSQPPLLFGQEDKWDS